MFKTTNISNLACSLRNTETDEFITLENPTANFNYSFFGRSGKSIFKFNIDEAGKYELKAWDYQFLFL
ncbi:hypothetical protein RBH29_10405 [Herbivorax sp. ANBcel31]|uniref:hypothetical protein n=1 Tax=Herbivorax sp. ANBcel31 TaxID=3069754 RepID=UPI0027B00D1C|nr:hypothetical protein [Herbivorax sp. ANBcel31]MDQ2086836.1 hypothetical protein [Herbivorax sp. ANBcel31]